jgi:geranylgeranyl diphosphate synthase type I
METGTGGFDGMDFKEYNEKVRKKVDDELVRLLDIGDHENLRRAMMHIPLSGGKRLRPTLAILVADAVSGKGEKAIPFGITLEVVHNFTLVHDDIMDKDDFRRGIPTVHTRWDEATAINAGDALFARAFEILSMTDASPDLFRRLVNDVASMVRRIGEGQQWDMEFEKREDVQEEEYLKMIEHKTALMFMTGAKGGALIAGGTEAQAQAMWDYGRHIGVGFQIHDDWLNLAADPTQFKKPIGGDLKSAKKTIIIIHAFANGTEGQLAPVRAVFGNQDATKEQVDAAIKALKAIGSLDYAAKRAKEHAIKAREMLDTLHDSEYRKCLEELISYMVERPK